MKIEVGGRAIGGGAPVFVIAEIGTNFSGIDQAAEMIQVAAQAGADAVKFQTYRAETVALPGAMFTLEDGSQISQYEFFKARELSRDAHVELKRYAEANGVLFFSTPGHYEDVRLLEEIGVPLYKTGSDDLTNCPFLAHVAGLGKPMIVSTGMCTLGEVERAVAAIRGAGNEQLVLLHCVVSYPASPAHANLRAMDTLRQAFGAPVGFSDHCQGSLAAVLSVGLGAVAIEKHLTLDRSAGGPDNDVACEPGELKGYVADIRVAESALGTGRKEILETERPWRAAARKSIAASRDIAQGEEIRPEMLAIKRPGTGLHPHCLELVVGRRARVALRADQLVSLDHLC
jgi:sialic acid synthase SpsE